MEQELKPSKYSYAYVITSLSTFGVIFFDRYCASNNFEVAFYV